MARKVVRALRRLHKKGRSRRLRERPSTLVVRSARGSFLEKAERFCRHFFVLLIGATRIGGDPSGGIVYLN
ncbi:MAG: hypothetical protein RL077_1769 [Verrucomicrobiota bacterium]